MGGQSQAEVRRRRIVRLLAQGALRVATRTRQPTANDEAASTTNKEHAPNLKGMER